MCIFKKKNELLVKQLAQPQKMNNNVLLKDKIRLANIFYREEVYSKKKMSIVKILSYTNSFKTFCCYEART